MKPAGFDAIVVTGQAECPVCLWVHDQKVEIRDASPVWGRDTYEFAELFWKQTVPKASPACIGPAGERRERRE